MGHASYFGKLRFTCKLKQCASKKDTPEEFETLLKHSHFAT